jgi:hypothetical protein
LEFNIGASFLVTNTDALNCWLGISGGATAAASAACAAGQDTCKVNVVFYVKPLYYVNN